MLTEALAIRETEFGREASELVPTLMALGDIAARRDRGDTQHDRGLDYYRKALNIVASAKPVDVEAVADLELLIGSRLARGVSVTQGLRYARSAHSAYVDLLGTQHEKTALAALALAQMYSGQSVRAESRAQEAVEFFAGKAQYVDHLIQARRLLMGIYLHTDDEDRFNEQLVEVGRLAENFAMPEAEQPILRYVPEYPAAAAEIGAEGYVVVEFTVDEAGRVQDPFVVESSRDHGSLFHAAALAAIRQYRYIPRHVNGLPVSVDGIRSRISFVLETVR
jgi:TonB family protein